MRPLVHLHTHSTYSVLDGACTIDGMVSRAKELGMNALALSDHGSLSGSIQFYKACHKAGIKPILGCEIYSCYGSRHTKTQTYTGRPPSPHLTLLARNRIGFKNLIKLTSLAYTEGFYHRPRVDHELLQQYSQGITCLSGCVSGELSRAILSKEMDKARSTIEWFHSIYGDNYFCEIMDNNNHLQDEVRPQIMDLANEMGIPLVCTSDVHYLRQEDYLVQETLMEIKMGTNKGMGARSSIERDAYFLRSPEQMYECFPGLEHAVARTQEIADSVDIDLELGKRHFPSFKVPDGDNACTWLRGLCFKGMATRYGEQWNCNRVLYDRVYHELQVINKLGFNEYFLIIENFTTWARARGIPNTARGSAAGAIVCYALHISHVDPIKHGLLFERFLDPSRTEAPDIDCDFCKERRGEVMQYLRDKYGHDSVAQIGTFGTLAARAALKDVGRVYGMNYALVNQLAQLIPEQLDITIDKALNDVPELKHLYENSPAARSLIVAAKGVEGLVKNISTHAAAIVIAPGPLTDYVPLMRAPGSGDIVTAWSMDDVEAAGLVKMDLLGLRNLTIMSDAVNTIENTTGVRIDPERFIDCDTLTYDMICRGELNGVFQLDGSPGMVGLTKRLQPRNIDDISVVIALYRPGTLDSGMVDVYVDRRQGKKPVPKINPVADEILGLTYGVPVFQETIMKLAHQVAGIPLPEAYSLIKSISKKIKEKVAAYKVRFVEGCIKNGVSEKNTNELWGVIEASARYSFNASHSVAYARIAFQTAYLKAHYPVEFMAAVLTSNIPGRNFTIKDDVVLGLEDCRRMRITVMSPDINTSGVNFAVDAGRIIFALSAIKNVGRRAAEDIVAERLVRGPFTSLIDFCERLAPGKGVVHSLVKAGAFDKLGNRGTMLETADLYIKAGKRVILDRVRGQELLF